MTYYEKIVFEQAQENIRATSVALETLKLEHKPDNYFAGNTFNVALDIIKRQTAENATLTQQVETLAAALKPFGSFADACVNYNDDDQLVNFIITVNGQEVNRRLFANDFRKAQAALRDARK